MIGTNSTSCPFNTTLTPWEVKKRKRKGEEEKTVNNQLSRVLRPKTEVTPNIGSQFPSPKPRPQGSTGHRVAGGGGVCQGKIKKNEYYFLFIVAQPRHALKTHMLLINRDFRDLIKSVKTPFVLD